MAALAILRHGFLAGASLATVSVTTEPVLSQPAAVTVTGTLTDEGVQCQALRGNDGALYTIRRTNAVRALRAGDRIRVEGKTAEVSICQQGITIDVTRLEKAD